MKPVTAEDVFDLMDGFATSAALNAAMELGLFWLLSEQPMDAANIAQVVDIPENRCLCWLELLRSTGLIERGADGYSPTPTARAAILDAYSQETWAFLAGEARDRFPAVLDLTNRIRHAGSVWEVQGLEPPDYFAQMQKSPDRARRFTRMLYEIHRPLAEQVAGSLDMGGVDRLMDVGGGSGVVSLALLRRYPHLASVVVDIPGVCAAGREISAETSVRDRISYHAADYLHDELPSGFGLALVCDSGPYREDLFRKIWKTLLPWGRLVVVDTFAPAKGVIPRSWRYWAFLASLVNPGVALLTVPEVRDRLERAGYQILSQRALSHEALQRWSSDWVLIEARRGP
jgi:ubiquinone/menaquinone biosynthesis C-methylase UbiE